MMVKVAILPRAVLLTVLPSARSMFKLQIVIEILLALSVMVVSLMAEVCPDTAVSVMLFPLVLPFDAVPVVVVDCAVRAHHSCVQDVRKG